MQSFLMVSKKRIILKMFYSENRHVGKIAQGIEAGLDKTDQKNVTMRSKDFLKRSDTVRSIPFKRLAPNPGFMAISLSRLS
jgi:hypothetical protein